MSSPSKANVPVASRARWLLYAPAVAVLIFVLSTVLAHSSAVVAPWWPALRFAAVSYGSALAALLFVERHYWPQVPDDYRFLEISIAVLGLAASAFLLFQSSDGPSSSDFRNSAFGTVASAVFFVPRRTDRIRAWAFVLMAIAMFRLPLLAVHPPYVSISIFCSAAAVVCLAQTSGGRTAIRRTLSVGAIMGALMTIMSIGAFSAAYQTGSTLGLLGCSLAILFFGIGTVVVVTRGDWFERHPRR